MSIKSVCNIQKFVSVVVNLPFHLGPKTLNTLFQVIDGKFSYMFLLKKHWIHALRFIASIIHRCLKFEYEWKVYNIEVEKNV